MLLILSEYVFRGTEIDKILLQDLICIIFLFL